MKTQIQYLLLLSMVTSLLFNGCKDDDDNIPEEPETPVIEHTFDASSIIGENNGSLDPTRKGFIDLYDGIAYTQNEANVNSSKIDFAYNYHGGGCSSCRFFENVKSMSTRTGYVQSFSVITESKIVNAEARHDVSPDDFDGISTSEDIERLFSDKQIEELWGSDDVTNRETDVAIGRVFAFIDKNGQKGFFLIGDYQANVPDGDPATLSLHVKIQPKDSI